PQSSMSVRQKQGMEIVHLNIQSLSHNRMNRLLTALLLLFTIFPDFQLQARQAEDLPFIEISKIHLQLSSNKFSSQIAMAYIAPDADVKKVFSCTNFQPGVIHPGFIPIDRIPQQILLRFNLSNDGDSVKSVWFFPGLYYNSIEMYRVNTEGALEK